MDAATTLFPLLTSSNVHGGQDGLFVPERINDIPRLKELDKTHGVGEVSKIVPLFSSQTVVENQPSNQSRTKLGKELDVKAFNARVQLSANHKLQHICLMPSSTACQIATLLTS